MTQRIDLNAYFARIGYEGPRVATLDTLRELHLLHPSAIPFENLTPLAGREVSLDIHAIEQKLVHGRRGGYCFEHNLLFLTVLRALGFEASGLSARVLWNREPLPVPARGHMLLRVDLGGATYVADVGFGGLTLTAPLLFEAGTVQSTPHERCRLLQGPEGDFQLEAEIASEWKPLYRFDTSPAFPSDYAVASYFLCKHPQSHFRSDLMVARVGPECRWVLRNARLSEHRARATLPPRVLMSLAEFEEVLEGTFGINLPEDPELIRALERLLGAGS